MLNASYPNQPLQQPLPNDAWTASRSRRSNQQPAPEVQMHLCNVFKSNFQHMMWGEASISLDQTWELPGQHGHMWRQRQQQWELMSHLWQQTVWTLNVAGKCCASFIVEVVSLVFCFRANVNGNPHSTSASSHHSPSPRQKVHAGSKDNVSG